MDQESYHRWQEGVFRRLASGAKSPEQRCEYLDQAAYHALQSETWTTAPSQLSNRPCLVKH